MNAFNFFFSFGCGFATEARDFGDLFDRGGAQPLNEPNFLSSADLRRSPIREIRSRILSEILRKRSLAL